MNRELTLTREGDEYHWTLKVDTFEYWGKYDPINREVTEMFTRLKDNGHQAAVDNTEFRGRVAAAIRTLYWM